MCAAVRVMPFHHLVLCTRLDLPAMAAAKMWSASPRLSLYCEPAFCMQCLHAPHPRVNTPQLLIPSDTRNANVKRAHGPQFCSADLGPTVLLQISAAYLACYQLLLARERYEPIRSKLKFIKYLCVKMAIFRRQPKQDRLHSRARALVHPNSSFKYSLSIE